MNDKKHWMIYGANGFTGRLIAAEAKRQGLAPVLPGRSSGSVEALTHELSLPSRVFDLSDRAAARAALADVAVVANCAGPFSATSQRMIDACLATRTHYVDITGEIAVFVDAQRQHDVACARRRLLHALAVDGSALRRAAARIERDRDQLIVTGARTAAPETAIMDLPRAAPQRWRRPFDQSE